MVSYASAFSVLLLLSTCDFSVARSNPGPGFVFSRQRGRCTPEYWSKTTSVWPRMVPYRSTVSRVFGVGSAEILLHRYDGSDSNALTLIQAASLNDDVVGNDVYVRLLKQSTAALLNSYTRPGFPFKSWEVKSLVIRAVGSQQAATRLAHMFLEVNTACV